MSVGGGGGVHVHVCVCMFMCICVWVVVCVCVCMCVCDVSRPHRWVVVHGLAGFGKTVAAAEAIRHAPLLREVFPGGVNWLTVGQMTDPSGDLDTAKLLNKLQTLILRLDEDKSYRPPSVEAATDYLQEVGVVSVQLMSIV